MHIHMQGAVYLGEQACWWHHNLSYLIEPCMRTLPFLCAGRCPTAPLMLLLLLLLLLLITSQHMNLHGNLKLTGGGTLCMDDCSHLAG